ncbi:hypothetical protein EAF04_004067 [Stromatinia cepivora]|nr:hypothetical protein EAF04_004067 [Stromatinia cepivora]
MSSTNQSNSQTSGGDTNSASNNAIMEGATDRATVPWWATQAHCINCLKRFLEIGIDTKCLDREGQHYQQCVRDGCACIAINHDCIGPYIMYIGSLMEDPNEAHYYKQSLMKALERMPASL